MDPRQPPQHPFSRNTASPYGRTPFPPSANPPPFPTSSHPPNTAPSYSDHHRRPSDPPYYTAQRSYAPDGPSIAGPGHSRHQSASSVGHGTPVNRGMPPPSSPQQQASQAPHHSYGPPPPPRGPAVSLGPPTTFPSRELPALPPIGGGRPQNNGSSMSISSMLGGPPTVTREPPTSQYASPIGTSAAAGPIFPGPTHPSPRMSTTTEYSPFRRPQTPEHPRPSFETRDHRANSAGSPPQGIGHYTPEGSRRFGTPQYTRPQVPPMADERREPPSRVPNPNSAIPPRPSSQPSFNPPQHRPHENPRLATHTESMFGRRPDNVPRPPDPPSRAEPQYSRPPFEERPAPGYSYAERDRQEREREAAILRERERERERVLSEQASHAQQEYAHQMAAQRNPPTAYNRPPEPREQPWMRANYEPTRPAYEPHPPDRPVPQQPQASNGYEYPTTTAPQYGGPAAYASHEPRYPPASQPSSMPQQPGSISASQYEATIMERERDRARLAQQQQHQQQQHPAYSAGSQNGPYPAHESPGRRNVEESQPMQQQRSFLGVQEFNRKGRLSPLPQAVQGAQGQQGGPGGEPGIKSEFGRMFSGIGSGVGAMGVPSPVSAGPQAMPFSHLIQGRRDDLEIMANHQEMPLENGGHNPRSSSRGGGSRRRKLKEEDGRGDDESSNGRRTPSGRGKRAKTHHHHHHHHHHHRPEPIDHTSSPSQSHQTPFKNSKGSMVPSPPGTEPKQTPGTHHHHVPISKSHHHVTPAKTPAEVNPIIPLPKTTIKSNAVLESVADRRRDHLGHGYYEVALRPGGESSSRRLSAEHRGFASTPKPLPRFEGKENCTFTIKVPRVHLTDGSREEITRRRAVWGTEIYTDDSDVIAACIHEGWFRGAWPDDVDVSLLDLELSDKPTKAIKLTDVITSPPSSGPMFVPGDHDLEVKVLILPPLGKYHTVTRFGIKSREWGGKHGGYQGVHDGLSFKILSIQWVTGIDGQQGKAGVARSKIFKEQLSAQELEDEETLAALMANGNGGPVTLNGLAEESFERGGDAIINGEIKGIGSKSWNKPKTKSKAKNGEVLAEKPASVNGNSEPVATEAKDMVEKVTETMIENANSSSVPEGTTVGR
ncbi:histone deacetylation protein Rxt3-domain-containing protein [Halenospora varia]|nr:histone deacetylation protein Rxt3-domain-containing protein [Halenospora varia]